MTGSEFWATVFLILFVAMTGRYYREKSISKNRAKEIKRLNLHIEVYLERISIHEEIINYGKTKKIQRAYRS